MFAWLQYGLPRRCLSRLVGWLASKRFGVLTRSWVKLFIRVYRVDMGEAEQPDYRQYATFNAFFTRALQAGSRQIVPGKSIMVSPVDGYLSEYGVVRHEVLLQAKQKYYSLRTLLAGRAAWVEDFAHGSFFTAYLSPKDYHRVHMPLAGTLEEMLYVPGDLFAVKPESVRFVEGIFARNERLIMIFSTSMGRMAVIMVGALIVGSMTTVWHGKVRPSPATVTHWDYRGQSRDVEKGDELGYFELGSSVIVLSERAISRWDIEHSEGAVLRLGQRIADAG